MPTVHPQARLQESQRQCDALLQGVSYMVPQRMLTLFTWAQLETLTCGSADIDVDLLRSRTKYGVGVSPNQRHVRYFWAALRKFAPAQRTAFLRFVWGRNRLPQAGQPWPQRFVIDYCRDAPDGQLPEAHTCFFSIDLPAYSTEQIMRDRLLTAIHFGCGGILNG